jgi:hypothetical protein
MYCTLVERQVAISDFSWIWNCDTIVRELAIDERRLAMLRDRPFCAFSVVSLSLGLSGLLPVAIS